jgi:hypothetical protein
MKKARSILAAGCTALFLAAFSLGCATSKPGTLQAKVHSNSCAHCTITVVDEVPLPVSSDLAVARLDQSWTIMEHTCSCCQDSAARFFASAGFQDSCELDATTGLCCVGHRHPSTDVGLAQVTR